MGPSGVMGLGGDENGPHGSVYKISFIELFLKIILVENFGIFFYLKFLIDVLIFFWEKTKILFQIIKKYIF